MIGDVQKFSVLSSHAKRPVDLFQQIYGTNRATWRGPSQVRGMIGGPRQ